MGKSAQVLGREFGKTAREMNALLKKHGYLYGEPGAYGLTEKGEQFGDEQHHTNGYGGYAYRQWETRTWNDETEAALRADIEANPAGVQAAVPSAADAVEYEPDVAYNVGTVLDGSLAGHGGRNEGGIDWKVVATVAATLVVGAVMAAPHVKPFLDDKVKPAAKRVRSKLTGRGSDEAQPLGSPRDTGDAEGRGQSGQSGES